MISASSPFTMGVPDSRGGALGRLPALLQKILPIFILSYSIRTIVSPPGRNDHAFCYQIFDAIFVDIVHFGERCFAIVSPIH